MTTRFGVAAFLILLGTVQAASGPTHALTASHGSRGTWTEYFQSARAQARKLGRPILANFSGSDWCGWCIRLNREVFSQPEFRGYASSNLVLFVADFPRQAGQDARIARQNQLLGGHYRVSSYPTVLLLDPEGRLLAETGFKFGGPETYVTHLKELLAKSGWTPLGRETGTTAP